MRFIPSWKSGDAVSWIFVLVTSFIAVWRGPVLEWLVEENALAASFGWSPFWDPRTWIGWGQANRFLSFIGFGVLNLPFPGSPVPLTCVLYSCILGKLLAVDRIGRSLGFEPLQRTAIALLAVFYPGDGGLFYLRYVWYSVSTCFGFWSIAWLLAASTHQSRKLASLSCLALAASMFTAESMLLIFAFAPTLVWLLLRVSGYTCKIRNYCLAYWAVLALTIAVSFGLATGQGGAYQRKTISALSSSPIKEVFDVYFQAAKLAFARPISSWISVFDLSSNPMTFSDWLFFLTLSLSVFWLLSRINLDDHQLRSLNEPKRVAWITHLGFTRFGVTLRGKLAGDTNILIGISLLFSGLMLWLFGFVIFFALTPLSVIASPHRIYIASFLGISLCMAGLLKFISGARHRRLRLVLSGTAISFMLLSAVHGKNQGSRGSLYAVELGCAAIQAKKKRPNAGLFVVTDALRLPNLLREADLPLGMWAAYPSLINYHMKMRHKFPNPVLLSNQIGASTGQGEIWCRRTTKGGLTLMTGNQSGEHFSPSEVVWLRRDLGRDGPGFYLLKREDSEISEWKLLNRIELDPERDRIGGGG